MENRSDTRLQFQSVKRCVSKGSTLTSEDKSTTNSELATTKHDLITIHSQCVSHTESGAGEVYRLILSGLWSIYMTAASVAGEPTERATLQQCAPLLPEWQFNETIDWCEKLLKAVQTNGEGFSFDPHYMQDVLSRDEM
ncbi:hypothetical protein KEM56_001673 [Ascosphaera pollenicola]|nr:hypothetical protein KEM56_001673 [Ascosphaera pollenicola]